MNPIRVLIVSSDRLTRDALANLVRDDPLLEALPPVDEEAAAAGAHLEAADILLWDLGWQADEALEALHGVVPGGPPVVALATDAEHANAAREAGVASVLPRSATADALRAALLGAMAGLEVRDPSFETAPPQPRDRPEGGETLTARETEVLQLMAEGLANKTIALRLGIRETTVKFHVNSILAKFGAQSRTEAVARAARLGLVIF